MRKTKLFSLVQLYRAYLCCHLYERAPEHSSFESDKFPLLFWKNIPKIPDLELGANKIGGTFLDIADLA